MLADEELMGVTPKTTEVIKEEWTDIGYYTDSRGIKHYGPIPTKSKITINYTWEPSYDDTRIRSSDPRAYEGYI